MNMKSFLKKLNSEATKESYGRYIRQFIKFHKTSQIKTTQWNVEQAENALEVFRQHLLSEGKSGQTIQVAWAAIKMWFTTNRIPITIKLKYNDKSKTFLDYIPTKDAFRKVLDLCRLDYKVGVCLMGFSGMRPSDVRELKYKNIKASYERGDDVLTITLKDRKKSNWFFTFLGPQGTRYIRELIEQRKQNGEQINDESYVVTRNEKKLIRSSWNQYMRYVITNSVGKTPTNEPFRQFRSYGFRKYFRRWARRLGTDIAEFLMGHKAGMQALSSVYIGILDLDPQIMDEIKQEYIQHLPELETEIMELTVTNRMDKMESDVHKEFELLRKENATLKARLNSQSDQDILERVLASPSFMEKFSQEMKKRLKQAD